MEEDNRECCFYKLGVLVVGVLIIRTLLFLVNIRDPHVLRKLPNEIPPLLLAPSAIRFGSLDPVGSVLQAQSKAEVSNTGK